LDRRGRGRAAIPNAGETMHIIHTVTSTDIAASGPSYSVPALANAQIGLGHTGAIYTLDTGAPAYFPDVPRRAFRRRLAGLGPLAKLAVSPDMRRALQEPGADVVHTHGLWQLPLVYAVNGAVKRGIPSLVTPRGMLSEVALSYSRRSKALISKLFQNGALARASAIHVTAESELAEVRAFGLTQPACVIPNGVDIPSALPPRAPQAGRQILTLGRIHRKKGLDILIEAWARLEARFPDWSLTIVGPDGGEYQRALEAQIARLGLQRVTFPGPLVGEDKTRAYAESDLFVLPTLSENFAMTVAESLACATPVISTKGAPWSGLVDNRCGWWIDQGTDPLAQSLEGAMRLPPEALAEMGRNGRAWMERAYSWESIGAQSLDVYAWLRGAGARPACVDV
jgi:glycosyltransferase involved in cell wall biosynthesis